MLLSPVELIHLRTLVLLGGKPRCGNCKRFAEQSLNAVRHLLTSQELAGLARAASIVEGGVSNGSEWNDQMAAILRRLGQG